MADAFVIQVADQTAGIAVADGKGYRFYASESPFFRLDGSQHGSVAAAQQAARRVYARGAAKGTGSGLRQR